MTFQSFIEKWDGEYCEIAGSANAKNQCTDLANAYLRDVLDLPIIEWTNAVDFPKKWAYEIIKNTTDAIPLEGDLIIWSNNIGGGAGHIAIFLEGTKYRFTSFDQNYPLYSPCHAQGHTYSNVSYFLRYNKPVEDIMTQQEEAILKFIKESGASEGDVRQGIAYVKEGTVKNLEEKISNDLKQNIIFLGDLMKDDDFSEEKILKYSSISTLEPIWQKAQETAKNYFEKMETDKNNNFNLYRTKNDEYNELKKQIDNAWELFKLLVKKLSWKK